MPQSNMYKHIIIYKGKFVRKSQKKPILEFHPRYNFDRIRSG